MGEVIKLHPDEEEFIQPNLPEQPAEQKDKEHVEAEFNVKLQRAEAEERQEQQAFEEKLLAGKNKFELSKFFSNKNNNEVRPIWSGQSIPFDLRGLLFDNQVFTDEKTFSSLALTDGENGLQVEFFLPEGEKRTLSLMEFLVKSGKSVSEAQDILDLVRTHKNKKNN